MMTALAEWPRQEMLEWTENLETALEIQSEEMVWEPLVPATCLLAPPPWPRGSFVIDPESPVGPL